MIGSQKFFETLALGATDSPLDTFIDFDGGSVPGSFNDPSRIVVLDNDHICCIRGCNGS